MIKKRRDAAKARKERVQPYLLFVGSYNQVSSSYIVVDELKFPVENPLAAVDLTFKIFWAANLKYPQDCVTLWLFLQRAVYQIKVSTDKIGTQLNKLFSALRQTVNIAAS